MNAYRTRLIDPTKILTRRELAIVLAELKRKAERSPGTWLNLVIFRLAACCGLRVSELASLRLADVRVEVARPHIVIRRGAAKGRPFTLEPLLESARTRREEAVEKFTPVEHERFFVASGLDSAVKLSRVTPDHVRINPDLVIAATLQRRSAE